MRHLALLCTLALAPGCGGDDGAGADGSGTSGSDSATTGNMTSGGSSGGGGANLPTDDSEAAIAAFLDEGGYLGDGWTAHSPTPTDATDPVSPHLRFVAYHNDALRASVGAGNEEPTAPHDAYSMAVKELYDDSDTLVGKAAMLKTDGTAWTYYCWGPAMRCSTESPEYTQASPQYGQDLDAIECHSCHAGNVFTPFP